LWLSTFYGGLQRLNDGGFGSNRRETSNVLSVQYQNTCIIEWIHRADEYRYAFCEVYSRLSEQIQTSPVEI